MRVCIACQHTEALSFPFQQMCHSVVSMLNSTSPSLLWNMSCLPVGILYQQDVWYDLTFSFKAAETLTWTKHRRATPLTARWATLGRTLERLVSLSHWKYYGQVHVLLALQLPRDGIFCDVWNLTGLTDWQFLIALCSHTLTRYDDMYGQDVFVRILHFSNMTFVI